MGEVGSLTPRRRRGPTGALHARAAAVRRARAAGGQRAGGGPGSRDPAGAAAGGAA